MRPFFTRAIVRPALVVLLMSQAMSFAQMGGSRAGVERGGTTEMLPMLSRDAIESFIAIDGRAEVRLKPTQIRIVLAVTADARTAQECQAAVKQQIDALRAGWLKLTIPNDKVVEDFIAVLPNYQWDVEKRGDRSVNVEKQTGFKMQTNLHLAVTSHDAARAALSAAFDAGITDIIAVDYFSPEIELAKTHARELALKSAKSKADVLLTVFEKRPTPINIQEDLVVRRPETLYESVSNSLGGEMTNGWREGNIPTFHAPRPRNTYYKGFQSTGDIVGSALPMNMEISVVSNIRIYYESPAAPRRPKPTKE